MAVKKYVLDYHAAKLGCQIKWLIAKSQSKRLVPFVDYIRCDLDGENYTFLKASHGDFKEVAFAEFHEKQHKQGNVVSFYYTAWIETDLDKHPIFKKALSFSSQYVEVALGFKINGEVIRHCYETIAEYPVLFSKTSDE